MITVSVSVIGAGSWAVGSHLENIRRSGRDVEFRGVCRLGPEMLTSIQNSYGFRYASEDYRDIVEKGADIFIVASPPMCHYEHAAAALSAGGHVLIEKPFTLLSEDAWDLADRASRCQQTMVIAFGWNYTELAARAKSILSGGGVGVVEAVSVTMASAMRELLAGNAGDYVLSARNVPPDPTTWSDLALSGGGYGQGQLSHALGLLLWLTDLRAEEVKAVMGGGPVPGVEYHDAFCIRFRGGAVGSVFGGSRQRPTVDDGHHLTILVLGSDGSLEFDVGRGLIVHRYREGRAAELRLDGYRGAYDCLGPLEAILKAADGKPVVNHSPPELGARTVEILEAAYARSHDRASVWDITARRPQPNELPDVVDPGGGRYGD